MGFLSSGTVLQMANSRAKQPAKLPEALPKASPVKHVAIIMDGNRRWADTRGLPRLFGHKEGVQSLKKIVRHAGELGLKYLTVYAFSSENWQRSREEVDYLFELFGRTLIEELDELCHNNVKLSFLGQLEEMPAALHKRMQESVLATRLNSGLSLQVAINYGSRLEITEAVKKIALALRSGELTVDQINDSLINSYLYTSGMPDPELIIRTGGEMRLSNYLLWQAAYSELYVTPLLWPEFSPSEFDKAIEEFVRRERRYGGD
jgi:undecaprenyl diphosphate synthase